MDKWSKQYTACCWQFRLLQVWLHAFCTVQCASHFSVPNAKLPRGAESNILPHLPWWHSHLLADSWRTSPSLVCHFWLILRTQSEIEVSKCSFFRKEITCMAHWVSKDGVWPSNSNLKMIAECVLPQSYTEVHAFLGLVGHYRRFVKGFAHIAQPLSEYLVGEEASRKSEWVSLTEDAFKAFEAFKQACMTDPVLAFADYTKPFLWETDASRMDWGQCYCRSRQMGDTTLLPMEAEPVCLMRRTTTQLSSKSKHWSGQLQSISKSTCPTSLSWWGWITIHWHT